MAFSRPLAGRRSGERGSEGRGAEAPPAPGARRWRPCRRAGARGRRPVQCGRSPEHEPQAAGLFGTRAAGDRAPPFREQEDREATSGLCFFGGRTRRNFPEEPARGHFICVPCQLVPESHFPRCPFICLSPQKAPCLERTGCLAPHPSRRRPRPHPAACHLTDREGAGLPVTLRVTPRAPPAVQVTPTG